MKIPILPYNQSVEIWDSLQNFGRYDLSNLDITYLSTNIHIEDTNLTDIELEPLTEILESVKSLHMNKDKSFNSANSGQIDSDIVEPICTFINNFSSIENLHNIGFWRWISLIPVNNYFYNFINWRYKYKGHQINWGLTNNYKQFKEVYLYRAWLRGQKMFDKNLNDPYYYAKKGDSDIWRSHILRQEFGRDEQFVKAFLDTIYDKHGNKIIKSKKLREVFIPAIRAWTANSSFEHLSYLECRKLLNFIYKSYNLTL